MIQTYDLAALRRAVARLPLGCPLTIGDLYHGRVRGESQRSCRRRLRDWLSGYGYTASDTLAYCGGSVSTWTSAGGSGIGGAITCTSLAAGSARQGAKSTTTIVAPPNGGTNAVPPDFLSVQLTMQFTSAPTAGGAVSVYFGVSPSATAGTSNPGGLSGADAAVSNIDVFPQLLGAGTLWASNSIGTGVQQQSPVPFVNPDPSNSPYLLPVIYNNASVAFDATAAHTVLTVVPYWRQRAA